jgi:hypothetical protein
MAHRIRAMITFLSHDPVKRWNLRADGCESVNTNDMSIKFQVIRAQGTSGPELQYPWMGHLRGGGEVEIPMMITSYWT